MRFCVPTLLLAILLPIDRVAGEGLLIIKSNLWQKDELVSSLPYRSIEKFPTVHNVVNSAGDKTRISSDLVVKDYPFPSAKDLANLREESQVLPLEAVVAEWSAALKRFPSAAKHLKPRIAALRKEIARFRGGEVKADGEWMSKAALEGRITKLAAERERLIAKLAKEAREMEMTAAEWGSLDEEGRQRTRDARQAALLSQIAMDEQRRVEAEIQRQTEITAARAKLTPFERLTTDDTIVPPGLPEEEVKEYTALLAKLNEALKGTKREFAFKREARKLVLITSEAIHGVVPRELSSEVRIVKSDVDGVPSTFEIPTRDGKDSIVVLSKSKPEPQKSALLVLPAPEGIPLLEMQELLARLIVLASGKLEAQPEKPAPVDKPEAVDEELGAEPC